MVLRIHCTWCTLLCGSIIDNVQSGESSIGIPEICIYEWRCGQKYINKHCDNFIVSMYIINSADFAVLLCGVLALGLGWLLFNCSHIRDCRSNVLILSIFAQVILQDLWPKCSTTFLRRHSFDLGIILTPCKGLQEEWERYKHQSFCHSLGYSLRRQIEARSPESWLDRSQRTDDLTIEASAIDETPHLAGGAGGSRWKLCQSTATTGMTAQLCECYLWTKLPVVSEWTAGSSSTK